MTNKERKQQQKANKRAGKANLVTVPTKEQFNNPTTPVDIRKGKPPVTVKKDYKRFTKYAIGILLGGGAAYFAGKAVLDHLDKGNAANDTEATRKSRRYSWEAKPEEAVEPDVVMPSDSE